MLYEIVMWDTYGKCWDPTLVGAEDANRFATRCEAIACVPTLRALGDEWADARYGVREVDGWRVDEVG